MTTPDHQLKAVLDQAATPGVQCPTSTPTASRRRAQGRQFLARLGETLTVLFVIGIACVMWYTGAIFTLLALTTIGIPVEQLGSWRWAIPAGISLVELRWWPRGPSVVKSSAFTLIGGADGLSTLYGVLQWSAGRFIPFGTGYTLPEQGIGLVLPAALLSLVLTFVPERLVLWAIAELRALW